MSDDSLCTVIERLEEMAEKVESGETLSERERQQVQEDLDQLREALKPLVESMLDMFMMVSNRINEMVESLPDEVQEEIEQRARDADE